MKAKEMFEQLGYEEENEHSIIYELDYKNVRCGNRVSFGSHEITVSKNHEWVDISLKELKAIYEQCKELGWLDE